MSPEEGNRVFEGSLKTGNAESKKLNPYSNGIGLSICKQICESLEGEISCKTTLGAGSVFTFTMRACYMAGFDEDGESRSDGFDERANIQMDDIVVHGEDFSNFEGNTCNLASQQIRENSNRSAVSFQGVNFDLKVSRTTPIEILDKEKSATFAPLIHHLKLLEQSGCLNQDVMPGRVLYADDQFVNQASVKRQFFEHKIPEKLKLVSDG